MNINIKDILTKKQIDLYLSKEYLEKTIKEIDSDEFSGRLIYRQRCIDTLNRIYPD